MVWVLRPVDRGPPRYDFSSRYFTIKMHRGGQFGGIITQTYIGGSVSSFDYCHSDELSLIEFSHMGKEFYQKVRGAFVLIATDQDVMDFGLGFDVKKRVVQIYMKCAELTNVVGGTQASETIKNKSRPTPIVINEDLDHEDSDDYDPESSSSEDESDVAFHDSDYNLSDDDNLVETIPERNVQSEGVKLLNKPEIDQSYKETLKKLANIDGDSDNGSTYLSSGYSSSNEEGGSSKRVRKKYKLFNEQTDMDNPQFLVGMEFKLVEKMKGHVGEWVTTYTGNNKYEVSGPGRQYRVDLEHKICGCRRWDLNGIPFIHAVAAYSLFDQEPLDHVHQCYSKATYLKTYDNMLAPLNGKELWTTSLTQVMLPPDVCRKAGRPKTARRREPEEEATVPPDPTKLGKKGTKMTCSKCGVQGHNKRSCKTKEPVREQSAPVDEMAEQSAHGTSGVVQERANAAMGSGIKLPKTKPKRASKLTVSRQMNKTKHNQVEQNKGLTLSQPQSQVDDPVPS